jgi:riboflavin synthase
MFTGIIEKTARVIAIADGPQFRRITIATGWEDLQLGESIAVNGTCLTIAELGKQPGDAGFDVIHETLAKTNLGSLTGGDEVNLERALRVGDRFDGHFVQGHVDGTARLIDTKIDTEEWRFTVEAPHHLGKYLTPKGSVAIDGISLTIAAVRGNVFEVALIPTTLKLTTIGTRKVGWLFNLEADMMAKTIVHYLEQTRAQ